jgi:spore germination protein YaaH/flagellar hook assembly protein FlgD
VVILAGTRSIDRPPEARPTRDVAIGGQPLDAEEAVTRSLAALQAPRPLASAILVALVAASLVTGSAGAAAAPAAARAGVAGPAWQGDATAGSPLIAGSSPGAPAQPVNNPSPGGTGATDPMVAGAAGQAQPSIAYEGAMAHEHDHIVFQPGGRVTVGFTPSADDRWPVGGKAPVALPSGRASGRQMAASPEGSEWVPIGGPGTRSGVHDTGATGDPATTAPIDAPAGRSVAAARAVSFTPPAADPAVDPAAASGLRRQVFGFLPYWELSGSATRLNYDVLSTIAYFSVGADGSGNLKKRNADGSRTTGWSGWTSSNLTSVISAAHQHGTRVVLTISVFAWTTSQANTQRALLGSSAARLKLARQAAAAVRDRGADGVNLDFEPIASGYADEFVSLLRTLRSELNRVKSGYQITYDTTGYIGNYPLEASVGAGAADAVFIMGYDYRTASSSTAGSVDPLSGPNYDLADTVRAYTARISPSRVILGIPWYGRAWSTRTDAVRSRNISGKQYGYSTAVNYESVVALVAKYGRRWDSSEQSPYIVYRRKNCTTTYGCVTGWRQVYYDDAASMKRRYALVNDYGLRGAGMWALGYDGGHAELYRALSDSFLVDKSAPQAGVSNLTTTVSDEGFAVRWAAKDVSRVVSYDVQVSVDGGPWTAWLTGTKATSDVWLGADGHGYAFRVRARDSKGNAGSWNTTATWTAAPALKVGGFGRVKQDGLSYRTGPSTSAAKLGTLSKNTVLAVTRGPVTADGYTWWEVTQPIREWGPVSFVERGVWIASASSSSTYVVAYRAPNSTTVDAGLRGLDFGTGSASAVGSSAASVARRALSPDGDGTGDALRLRWTNTVALDSLRLNVYRASGALVGSRPVPDVGKGAQTWDWNGKAGTGVVPDGRYILQLVGVVGGKAYHAPAARPVTKAQVAAYAVTVDTVAPRLSSASASRTLFSPNGDGQKDTVRLALSATGATHWAVRIANGGGSIVRTVTGNGRSFAFTWNGTGDAGSRVADGRYTATLLAYDNAGNSVRRAYRLSVDTTPPKVTPAVSQPVFSPNGDHAADTTVLSWTADTKVWGTARVWKGSRLIRSWTVTARTAGSVTWDGRNAAGSKVSDGRYTFRVDVRDAARNSASIARTAIVDRTAGFLRWSSSFYPQDGDAIGRTASLAWTLSRRAKTTLRIYDTGGRLVRTVWSGRTLAAGTRHWTWGGRLANGSYVPQGRYVAGLSVTSALGTTELRRSVWVSAFVVSTSASTVRAGQHLTITFRTVESLRTRPQVSFTQPGRSTVTVRATRLSNGSYRAVFSVQRGAAGTATVRISARDSGGHRNVMALHVRVAS